MGPPEGWSPPGMSAPIIPLYHSLGAASQDGSQAVLCLYPKHALCHQPCLAQTPPWENDQLPGKKHFKSQTPQPSKATLASYHFLQLLLHCHRESQVTTSAPSTAVSPGEKGLRKRQGEFWKSIDLVGQRPEVISVVMNDIWRCTTATTPKWCPDSVQSYRYRKGKYRHISTERSSALTYLTFLPTAFSPLPFGNKDYSCRAVFRRQGTN